MSFGYNSGIAFSGSVSGIDDFAISLLQSLMTRRRRAKTEHNPLIFVCHSLGGIVFKKVVLAEQRRQHSAILLTIQGSHHRPRATS
jgi:surfactin synthase thioesterase subunit